MKTAVILSVLLVAIIFISGCAQTQQQVTCNKPYIKVGADCCLDKNDNGICDKDDSQPSSQQTPPAQQSTVVLQQSYCGDDVCQSGESCSTCPTDCGACPVPTPKYTISLNGIHTYGVGAAGAHGNGIYYTIFKDNSAITFDSLCSPTQADPTKYSCGFEITINGQTKQLSPDAGFSGDYLLYYCEQGNCIEDNYGMTITGTLRMTKDGNSYENTKTVTLT